MNGQWTTPLENAGMNATLAVGSASPAEAEASRPRLLWSFVFAYALGLVLLGFLIYRSGAWDFLANTRLLDPAVKGGIVSLRDDQPGFIVGVPDLAYWWKSQDPIDWPLIWGAAGIFVLFYWIKAFQYHGFCRATGVEGSFAEHARGYFWGQGMARVLPYNLGNVALASSLAGPNRPPQDASKAVFLGEVSILFETVAFALLGLYSLGWGRWFAQLFWPLVILAVSFWFARSIRGDRRPAILHGSWSDAVAAVRELAARPAVLAKLTLLGLLAFGLEDIAAYAVAMGFTGDRVIIDVTFGVLLMGVVGSYIARLVPITPGGIGQFEWGFALALYWGGLGLPECVALAILDNLIRYGTGTALMLSSQFGWGSGVRWAGIVAAFTRPESSKAA